MAEIYKGVDAGWPAMAIGNGAESFCYVARRLVIDVQAGDAFWIYAEAQVRNDSGWNVELAQSITVLDCDANGNPPPTFVNNANGLDVGRITPVNGWNITTGEHYGRASKGAAWVAPATKKVCIDFRLRARSSSAQGGGGVNLSHQQTQGMLDAIKL